MEGNQQTVSKDDKKTNAPKTIPKNMGKSNKNNEDQSKSTTDLSSYGDKKLAMEVKIEIKKERIDDVEVQPIYTIQDDTGSDEQTNTEDKMKNNKSEDNIIKDDKIKENDEIKDDDKIKGDNKIKGICKTKDDNTEEKCQINKDKTEKDDKLNITEGNDESCTIVENGKKYSADSRICDYIILDDDDDDPEQSVKTEPEWDSLCAEEIHIKEEPAGAEGDCEFVCETEGCISPANENPESAELSASQPDKSEKRKADELKKSSSKSEAANNTTVPLEKKESNEKLCDSLVLTLDEKELGEISDATEVKSNSNEDQTVPEKKTIPKDSSKESGDKKQTAEKSSTKTAETGHPEAKDKKPSDKKEKKGDKDEKSPKSTTESKKKKEIVRESSVKSKILWVSNLKRSTKATDLKQFLNKAGKVITTKIVTDGRRCFGYVVMETYKDVANCINNLDGTQYDDCKITLSTNKPPVENRFKTKETEIVAEKKEKEDPKKPKKDKRSTSKESKKHSTNGPKGKESKPPRRKRSPSIDPLTTKFDESGKSKDDRMQKEYLKERQERERLKRQLAIEVQKSREEARRLREKQEEQRRMEIKLEQERKRLRIEKELLEKERRELLQLEQEKRKIEKEKMNLMQQRLAIEKSIRETKRKMSPDGDPKSKKRRGREDDRGYEKFELERRRTEQKTSDRFANPPRRSKERHDDRYYGEIPKGGSRHEKESPGQPKHMIRKEDKGFGSIAPPPPKLSNDFDISKRKQMDEGMHYYGRKPPEAPAFKQDYPFRRNDFEKSKPLSSRGPDLRRDDRPMLKDDHYGHSGREAPQRLPAWSTTGSSEVWKVGPDTPASLMVNRYPSTTYPSLHYGSSRPAQSTFYNTPSMGGMSSDYNKYYYNNHNSRKY